MGNLLLLLYWVFFLSLFPSFVWLNRLSLTDWNGTNYNAGETTHVVLGAVAALGRGRALSHSGSGGWRLCVARTSRETGWGGGGWNHWFLPYLWSHLKTILASLSCQPPPISMGTECETDWQAGCNGPNKGTVVFLPAKLQVTVTWLSISTAFWAILELEAADSQTLC